MQQKVRETPFYVTDFDNLILKYQYYQSVFEWNLDKIVTGRVTLQLSHYCLTFFGKSGTEKEKGFLKTVFQWLTYHGKTTMHQKLVSILKRYEVIWVKVAQ